MKKLYPFILLLVLAALAVAVSFWRGRIKERPVIVTEAPATEQQNQSQETQTSNEDIANWRTYENKELGVKFSYPQNYEVRVDHEIEGIDTGKNLSIWLTDNSSPSIFGLTATSADYVDGAGEGCCFYYVGSPLDLRVSETAILEKIKKLEPFNLKKIKIGGKEAVRFYSVKGYVSSWVTDSILLPYQVGNFSNITISGPNLMDLPNQGEDGKWREFNDVKSELQNNILTGKYLQDEKITKASQIFDKILSTFKFLSTPAPAPVSTAGWKTYSSQEMGIEFKYPSSYFFLEEKEYNHILLGDKKFPKPDIAPYYQSPITIESTDATLNRHRIDTLADKVTSTLDFAGIVSSVVEGRYASYPGMSNDYRQKIIVIPSKNITINIQELYGGQISNWYELMKISAQIISTFKFIN